ncbi:hypothetical protein RMSM_02844 [Rhodopirellula maiorica SM1]|uniref:DUF7932 domain-containing protein n=1 Tax=Rhodopirellula maiorica SM1 TaxID=1265738 RepID=M5RLN5_9BACT|nr:hypothetical protein [Rhodopirellula maiorica]EMI20225.1 hypothetical protein RMSM_02844 [Rhodopirellula maiorica SM1]
MNPHSAANSDDNDPGCFASDGEIDCLAEIDLRGDNGIDGRDGESIFVPRSANGADGRRGEDAGPATAGRRAAAATIELTYPYNAGANAIAISGTAVASDGSSHPIELQRTIGEHGYVFIRVFGGTGGNGGRGGNGQPGAPGRPGRDATRFSNGTDGGPGGDGGDAGNPSDGQSGGDGGDITLQIDHQHLGLLMLVTGDLSGGDIGFAGEPAYGGRGGPGGPGGSSYHWTTTHRTGGKNGRTRTVHHSNPGGSTGRRGRDGAPSSYRAHDGNPGKNGRLRIVVLGPHGDRTQFNSPYDLELVSFDIASEYSVIEPDSLANLERITVRNCGGMPTPPNYTIHVHLPTDTWIRSDENKLVLPGVLEPGESYTFNDECLSLRWTNVIVNVPRKRPFLLKHDVNPRAFMESGIHRPFRNFENEEPIDVQFPLRLSEITALNSLAPGESTRVRFAITNIGDETFDDRVYHRSVRSGIRLFGGDINSNQLLFFDDTDEPHDLLAEEFRHAVRNLAAGETRWIETRIGIRNHSDVIAYQSFTLGVDLLLQHPGSSPQRDQYRRIDYRKETIRVSEQFRRDEGSRFLLIANQKTDVNDIEKWTQLADYFGSGLDVWDVAYYGFLDLARKIEADKSMLEMWRGMTIIIPNNYFQTPIGKKTAFEQLAKSQFLIAAADFDINFYIVGDSRRGGAAALQSYLIPILRGKTPSQIKTQPAFLKQIKRWNQYVARTGDVVGGITAGADAIADASLGAVHEFEIQKRTFLFQPKSKWLAQEAVRLQNKLRKQDPLHRWVIVYRNDTGDTDTSWGFFRKRKVGRLEARRSLDSSKGSAVLFEVDSIDIIGDDFINSEANKHGIFLTLKFEDKVDRFIRLVSERTFPRFRENYIDRPLTAAEIQQIGDALIDSIVVDLYNEQHVARHAKTWGTAGVKALLPKLNYLAERSLNYGLTYRQMQENEASLSLLYQLLGNVRYIATQSRTIWDYPVFPTALFKRSRAVSRYMQNRVDQIIANLFGPKLSWWDKWTSAGDDDDPFGTQKNAAPKGIARQTAIEAIDSWEAELRKQKTPLTQFERAQRHPGLTYDPELLCAEDRVVSGAVYDQWVQAEKTLEMQRAETEYAVAKQRSELLVPLKTASATPVQSPTQQTQP